MDAMPTLHVQTGLVVEIPFSSTQDLAARDPYNDTDLTVRFDGPQGPVSVPAYWAGDNRWKVRFNPAVPGTYRYTTLCSDEKDSGLHGREGSVEAHTYEGDSSLARRGRLRVADDKRHFVHADGTPFFWLGDTWWMGLSTRLVWPGGFRTLAADRVEKGFSVVQIIGGPYPDMDAWDVRGRNEAGFPFTKDFERINPDYYDSADLKIAHLVETGLVPCIVGMWGYYLPEIGVERAKRFWRNLVARYGAYPVVWCICGEGTMPYYLSTERERDAQLQKEGWTEVMRYVREIDGHRNLISIHPTQHGREQVTDPSLMDFEMLQTGHSDLDSVAPTEEIVVTAIDREPKMPVVNSEVNYEGILGRAWQNVQRLCFYKSVLNGTAGHTYGANGIWQLNEPGKPYGPSPHGRAWGNTAWTEAMHLPGSKQVGLGRRFMERFEWWRLERHPEWVEGGTNDNDPYRILSVGIPGELRIVYVPMLWNAPVLQAFEPEISYVAYYHDPRTGTDTDLGLVTPGSEGKWSPPFPPEVSDWLLVLKRQ